MNRIDQAAFDPPPDVLFSMNALRRAWRLVRRSGPSPGTDGVTQDQFEERLDVELNRLRQHLIGGTYQPQPVRRFYIKKASGKQRPISIWSMRDRVAQRVVHDYLTPLLERFFLDCSYGFRPERSVDHAIQAVIAARDRGLVWVLDTDISDCFGSIQPALLMAQLRRVVPSVVVLKLVDQWLHTPVAGGPAREKASVSQGGVISPQLANLYLHRFDEMILAALPQAQLVRFADDFVIVSRSEQEAAWSLDVARRSLENLRLALNMRKTRIVHFDEGFTFLGVVFKGRWHKAAIEMEREDL
jgi:group II intron reverse transcriptase/maturase